VFFRGKPLLNDDGTQLIEENVNRLVRDICFSFQDLCRYAEYFCFYDTVGDVKLDNANVFFIDNRTPDCKYQWKMACFEFIKMFCKQDLMKTNKIPARMVARTLSAMYNDLALMYEEKGHFKKNPVVLIPDQTPKIPVLFIGRD